MPLWKHHQWILLEPNEKAYNTGCRQLLEGVYSDSEEELEASHGAK